MALATTSKELRMRRNGIAFAVWVILFGASFTAGHWFSDSTDLPLTGLAGVAYSLLPLVPGFMAFRAYLRFYREADEMMRKIQTDAIAFAFGVVVLFWGAIQLPEHVWLPKVKADLVMSVMLVSFSLSMIVGSIRRSQ